MFHLQRGATLHSLVQQLATGPTIQPGQTRFRRRNRRRAHAQFIQPKSHQQRQHRAFRPQFTAQTNPFPLAMYRLHGVVQRAQKSRVEAVVVARDLTVITIHRQQILRQVIAADTEEIDLFTALVDDKHHRWHFQHDAKRDLLIERNMFIAQGLPGFGQLIFHPQNLFHRGDHRNHNFQRAVRRGAQNRPELRAEQRLVLFVNSHRAIAKEGVVFRRDIEIGHRLIAADIHGANDNAAAVRRFQRLAKNIIKFIFGRRAGPVHIQHFGTEQAHRLRAVAKRRGGFNGVGNIGRHLQTQAIFCDPVFIKPRLLLAT